MPQEYSFKDLQYRDKLLIYQGLVAMVQANAGHGFVNSDQGHPAYAVGCNGKEDYEAFGDSSEHNRLYGMMWGLSHALNEASLDDSLEEPDLVFTWQDFCSLAYGAYKKQKEG